MITVEILTPVNRRASSYRFILYEENVEKERVELYEILANTKAGYVFSYEPKETLNGVRIVPLFKLVVEYRKV